MRIREMRDILKVIDDMPREEQLICVEKLQELWWDYDDNRFDCQAWWAEARREYEAWQACKKGKTNMPEVG